MESGSLSHLTADLGLSVQSLLAPLKPVWVSPGYSGFLSQSKNLQIRTTNYFTSPIGISVNSLENCLPKCLSLTFPCPRQINGTENKCNQLLF